MTKFPELVVLVPTSEVFDDTPCDFNNFKTLLMDLSLMDTIFWCARLLQIVSSPFEKNPFRKQQTMLDLFFTSDEIEKVNKYALRHGGTHKIRIFFRGQLLEIIRWACLFCRDLPEDGSTFEIPANRTKFAKVVLMAGEFWSERVYKKWIRNAGAQYQNEIAALSSFRKVIEDTQSAPELYRSLGRGRILFIEHFPKYWSSFESDFYDSTGLTVSEYYNCLIAVMCNYLCPDKGNSIFIPDELSNTKTYGERLKKFFTLETQSISQLKKSLWGGMSKDDVNDYISDDYDYKSLRSKPILVSRTGHAVIIDPVFYCEKSSVGPLFQLLGFLPDKSNELFASFGYAFEDYSNEILGRIYDTDSEVLAKRFKSGIKGYSTDNKELEIDAWINDVKTLTLFEMKAIWLREDKLFEDGITFLDYLILKYGEHPDQSSERKKGVAQLARIINIITSGNWLGDQDELKSVELLFPVLLVFDSLMSWPLIGNFLSRNFKMKLEEFSQLRTGYLQRGTLKVAPPIIMTIEELENLEISLRRFTLCELLRGFTEKHPDRKTSLHNYICFSKFKDKFYQNEILTDNALRILQDSMNEVFPEDSE